MGISKLFKKELRFVSADLKETCGDVSNPDRGWFKLYTFYIGCDNLDEKLGYISDEDESLVLLLVCIKGNENDRRKMASEIERIIDRFSKFGKDIILRITYDTSGHALENEPYDLQGVLDDADTIREILYKKGEKIFVFQGLLIGNWGEMHTSRYTDEKSLVAIYNKLNVAESGCFFAVRRPDFHMMLDNSKNRLGLFDDAIFGSKSDMGTYKDIAYDLDYESNISTNAPNGGEAIYGSGYIRNLSKDEITSFLQKKKITYLNKDYDLKLLDMLKNYDLFEYIGSHMGYRLTVNSVHYQKNRGLLKFTVRNSGFAPVYRETESEVVLKDSDHRSMCIPVKLDLLKKVSPDDTASCEVIIGDNVLDDFRKPVRVFLKTSRSFDGRSIRYANVHTEDGCAFLGELR